MMILELEGLQA